MKYIVEFEDEPCMYEDEVHYYKCIQAPWWGLSERVIKQLTPYQPDAPDANVGNITNLCGHEKDLISRQAALDAISAWRRDYPLDLQEPIDDCWNSVRELPAVEQELHWIPCSERLPYAEYGESDNVLTTCGYRDVEDGSIRWIKTLYFNGGNWCYPTGETYLEKVYAWMPLPNPYKGGDAE